MPYDSQYSDTGIARDVPGPRVTDHRRVGGDGIDQLDDGLVDDGLGPTLEQRQAQNISIIGTVGHRYDVLQEQFLDLRIRFVEHGAQAVAVLRDGQAEEQSAYQRGIELINAVASDPTVVGYAWAKDVARDPRARILRIVWHD